MLFTKACGQPIRRRAAALMAALLVLALCPLSAWADASGSTAMVQVIYASPDGNFATRWVSVSPTNNVVSPDPSQVPAGYVGVNTNPVTLIFNRSGAPVPNVIYFTYQQQTQPQATAVPGTGYDAQLYMSHWQVPGHVIVFGQYEQDNNLQNGKEPVEWIVLRTDGPRALLISRYALDNKRFNETWTNVSWEGCGLRAWLNSSFYNDCFNEAQKRAVLYTTNNSNYAGSGVRTQDYVFALSADECRQYMPAQLLVCTPTAYARAREVAVTNNHCYWWLRDTTNRRNDANRILPDGSISEYGGNTNAYGVGVRPVVWVNMNMVFGFQ